MSEILKLKLEEVTILDHVVSSLEKERVYVMCS